MFGEDRSFERLEVKLERILVVLTDIRHMMLQYKVHEHPESVSDLFRKE
jgi:hypothetical protein